MVNPVDQNSGSEKLVRDKIPEIIRKDRKVPHGRIGELRERPGLLLQKLGEEVRELAVAPTHEMTIEEMADVLEVLDALRDWWDISKAEVARVQKAKREEKGGFKKLYVLKEVKDE